MFTLQSFSLCHIFMNKQGVLYIVPYPSLPLKYMLKGRNGPSQFGRISLDWDPLHTGICIYNHVSKSIYTNTGELPTAAKQITL